MILHNPFPHVIVENFYSAEELNLIFNELKKLTIKDALMDPGIHHGLSGLTSSKAVALEHYCHNNSFSSDILRILRERLSTDFISSIIESFPQFAKLKYINNISTKIRYYHNEEKYESHVDIHQDFLTFSYFHKQPKKFTGGQLRCTDHNYTLNCVNNTFILIPGYVKHEVLTVKINNDDYWSGNGRYCVSQFLNTVSTCC